MLDGVNGGRDEEGKVSNEDEGKLEERVGAIGCH